MGVFRLSLGNDTLDLHHILAPEMGGCFLQIAVALHIGHYLCDAITVAEVDKGHAAHFPDTLHPAGESNLAARVGETELAACIGPVHIYMFML